LKLKEAQFIVLMDTENRANLIFPAEKISPETWKHHEDGERVLAGHKEIGISFLCACVVKKRILNVLFKRVAIAVAVAVAVAVPL